MHHAIYIYIFINIYIFIYIIFHPIYLSEQNCRHYRIFTECTLQYLAICLTWNYCILLFPCSLCLVHWVLYNPIISQQTLGIETKNNRTSLQAYNITGNNDVITMTVYVELPGALTSLPRIYTQFPHTFFMVVRPLTHTHTWVYIYINIEHMYTIMQRHSAWLAKSTHTIINFFRTQLLHLAESAGKPMSGEVTVGAALCDLDMPELRTWVAGWILAHGKQNMVKQTHVPFKRLHSQVVPFSTQ